ncbi:hypothetical protein PWG15_09620 [Ensifer adhaerens]|uniref:hypothetical protein n=1 Tax=Ensifer adhaerens TaxID=106592 RepID=UPI0023A93A2C|nr:hypothetical protein [Ensifer adhaerens]WDZ78722.1 hypothetical protein PWG15_09620 [Ensifer adhaerens]
MPEPALTFAAILAQPAMKSSPEIAPASLVVSQYARDMRRNEKVIKPQPLFEGRS